MDQVNSKSIRYVYFAILVSEFLHAFFHMRVLTGITVVIAEETLKKFYFSWDMVSNRKKFYFYLKKIKLYFFFLPDQCINGPLFSQNQQIVGWDPFLDPYLCIAPFGRDEKCFLSIHL